MLLTLFLSAVLALVGGIPTPCFAVAADDAAFTAALTAARFGLQRMDHEPAGEDGRYLGVSHDQNLRAWFGREGVTVLPGAASQGAGAWRVELRLKAYGYGRELRPAPPVTARNVAGNRVEYERGGDAETGSGEASVVDWYENGPGGIEQGFTLNARPERDWHGAAREPLRLVMEVAGTLRAQIRASDHEIELIGDDGTRALTYTGLVATDAAGKRLPSRMETNAEGREIALLVDDRGAAYPIVVDPILATEARKLTPSDGAQTDRFGGRVALSGDTVVVGAFLDDVAGKVDQGSVYVYVRKGATWDETRLTASDGKAGDQFGSAVAIRGDTIVVGARYADQDARQLDEGKAYVFTRSGPSGAWSEQKLAIASVANPPFAAYFGNDIAISGDTMVIGAPGEGPQAVGSAYVFTRTAGVWTQQTVLRGDSVFSGFGQSVAISGDTLLVGASAERFDVDGQLFPVNKGAAFVFTGAGATWTMQQKLFDPMGVEEDAFGSDVDLEGNTAVVAADAADVGGHIDQGLIKIFVRSGNTWSEQFTTSSNSAGDRFGVDVKLEGDTALVGAPREDVDGKSDQGVVHVYTRTGLIWTEGDQIKAVDGGVGDEFGNAVAILDQRIVVGAPAAYSEARQVYSGGVYVVQPSDTDGDALPDEWEKQGITVDAAGRVAVGDTGNGTFINLPLMGAKPLHKDIFVHVDWMQGGPSVLKPSARALRKVTDAFARAPVTNPDNKVGIRLHIDAGPTSVMKPGATWGASLSRAGPIAFQNAIGSVDAQNEFVWNAVDTAKLVNFAPSKRAPVFHYALFANDYAGSGGSSGIARGIPATDFLVTLGTWTIPGGTIDQQAGTFMHEFGHTLGLQHGGNDDVNEKPNYVSIMNYAFQLEGLMVSATQTRFDFSAFLLDPLDETKLNEVVGIHHPRHYLTLWNRLSRSTLPAGSNKCVTNRNAYHRLFLPTDGLDWDCDGVKSVPLVAADVNGDGACLLFGTNGVLDSGMTGDDDVRAKALWAGANRTCETVAVTDDVPAVLGRGVGYVEPGPVLTGFKDWPNLVFTGNGKIGSAGVAPEDDAATTPMNEPTMEQLLDIVPTDLLDEQPLAPLDEFTVSTEEGPASLQVDFDGTASTAINGTIVGWAWDFGDGTSGTGATTQHTYDTPGEYFASLTVTDSDGHVSLAPLETLITVTDPLTTPTALVTPTATTLPPTATVTSGQTPAPTTTPTPAPGSTPTQTPLRTATPTAGATASPAQTPPTATAVAPTASPTPPPQTFAVDRFDDGVAAACTDGAGDCTLRGAILKHDCGGGNDTIDLPAGVYRLTVPGAGEDAGLTGDLDVTSGNLTIAGDAANWTIIDGGGLDRVLHVGAGATLTLTGVTIRGGVAATGPGGGILNDGGSLTLTASAVVDNTALAANGGSGGGLANRSATATATIVDSTISGNHARDGGGIDDGAGADLRLANTTISGNRADDDGGGLRAAGAVVMSNVTITANTADAANDGTGDGGGIATNGAGASVVTSNTIVGGNTDRGGEAPDCAATLPAPVTVAGYTLLESTAGCQLDPGGDSTGLLVAAPDLGLLQLNGGPTETHLPNHASPVIDAGNPSAPGSDAFACESADQRGVARPFGAACDLGAVERKAFTVTTTADNGSDAAPIAGSLRAAIVDANARPGLDTIDFDIPGAGVRTITVAAPVMTYVRQAVVIDGYTQHPCASHAPPCAHPNTLAVGDDASLLIELNGASADPSAQGLGLFSGAPQSQGMVVVRGLVINRFFGGLVSGTNDEVLIEGNFLGTDPTGTTALGNRIGISLGEGFYAKSRSRIGGSRPAQRNLIAGNIASGVVVSSGGRNAIQGNYVGVTAAGTAALPNGGYGIVLGGSGPTTLEQVEIGGSALVPGTPPGNVVSGNGLENVYIDNLSGSSIGPVTMMGNVVGPDATGTTALVSAGRDGVHVVDLNGNGGGNGKLGPVTIGGAAPGAGNVISANHGLGVFVESAPGIVVEGNYIGTDVTGALSLGNDSAGIALRSGPALCADNVIAHNGDSGVSIASTFPFPDIRGVAIARNAIFGNASVGIDSFASFNDPGDADTGPNGRQNFPVLTAAESAGGKTALAGTLDSTAATTFTLEFFASPTCDSGGAGEGATFIGATVVTTDGSGLASFTATFAVAVPVGSVMTATATAPPAGGDATGSTSEFSACRAVGSGPVVTTPAEATPTPAPTPLCGSAGGAENCYDCIDNDGDGKVDRDDTADCPARADGQQLGLGLPGKGAKAIVKCAKTLATAGAKFSAAELKHLQQCVNAAFVCVQQRPGDSACVVEIQGRCAKELAKITSDAGKLRGAVLKACGPPAVDVADLRSVAGLGFDAETEVCGEQGVLTLTSAGDVADCLVAQHGCRVADLLASEVPRAAELLRLAGRDPAVELPCLAEGADGQGGALVPPKGKRAVKCQKAIAKGGAKFAALEGKLIRKCASGVYVCLQVKATDPKCRPKAAATCRKQLAKAGGASAKLAAAIAKGCGAAPLEFADLLAGPGLGFTALADGCTALGVSSLGSLGEVTGCLERRHVCRVEQMLESETPRLQELLEDGR